MRHPYKWHAAFGVGVSIGASASNLRLDDVPVDVADLGALLVGVARLSGV